MTLLETLLSPETRIKEVAGLLMNRCSLFWGRSRWHPRKDGSCQDISSHLSLCCTCNNMHIYVVLQKTFTDNNVHQPVNSRR